MIKYILQKNIQKKIKDHSLMQSQQSIQKLFFEQLKPGDFVDARFGDDDWKLAKVIDRENKCISIIYDGCPPNNQQLYINPLRVKPLRAVTFGYTGPSKAVYGSITSIPELFKHIQMITTILKTSQPPSAYKLTQYLRGDLFSNINSLLISDIKLSPEQITILNNFLIQLLDQICKICSRVTQFMPEYFQTSNNNKYLYLVNYKLAFVYSLQQLTYLANLIISQGNDTPKLLKNYKNQILQQNLINHMKKYLPLISQLCNANDGNGKWLPTYTRLNLSKILLKYKQQQKFLSTPYDVKDYLEYYNYWPSVLLICPTQQNEKKFIQYILTVMCKQSPFDTKLKSLVMLRKILQKQQKLTALSLPAVIQMINRKNVVNSLLQYFNPQIFKRYIPILKISSSQAKKSLTQAQVDDIFKIMKTSHESDINLIYQIIVSISQFITVETLDNIYIDIEKNIDINSQNGVKFVRDFTIKAIQNFNTNKNKGFLSSLIGIKKNSSKFGYYGLDLLCRQISDEKGRILAKNIAFTIYNIGIIFQNEAFHHERLGYMQTCINNIDKRQNYGQSIKLLHEIICTYPSTTYISQSQQSVVSKLDDKYKLIDIFIKGLKPLQKQCSGQTSKNINHIKVNFIQSIKYFYDFIQKFNSYLKNKLLLRHVNHLWHLPHIFQFLRKSKQLNDSEIPSWKRKYQKKISTQMMKSILTEILKMDQNIIPTEECFEAIHQLILSFNLGKSIELTQRATIRYINLQNIIGINFYLKFLEKIIAMNRPDWKKKIVENKNNELVDKVIRTIFQLHLRPHNHQSTQTKAQNWMKCLMKVMKTIYKQNAQICVNSIQFFLELIKGRQFKDITASGKLDILVSYQSKQKTVTLPRNSTILKLRNFIMEAYKIKCNFIMFNTSLKRDITFIEEEDFSINAMGHSIKGPTIIVKKVQQGQLYPQAEACQLFMNLIEKEQDFYKIVFGLLKKQSDSTLHTRIWKIIQKVPVNQATKSKIKNCKDFCKEDWVKFLLPNRMQQLQYSINIVYSLLTTSKWMQDFKKTKGNIVVQQLFLTMISSQEPLGEKIKIQLSKILLKIFQQTQEKKSQVEQQNGKKQKQKVIQSENTQNLLKISNKIMETLEIQVKKYQNSNTDQYKSNISIECLNLMMKMLLVLSLKKNCPESSIVIKYFLNVGVLLKISDIILFQLKNTDTTFFTQDILQRIILNQNLQFTYKCQILSQYIKKYLDHQVLSEKKSAQNYFTFLIDFLHSMDKDQSKIMYESHGQIVKYIKKYVEDVLGCNQLQNKKGNGERSGQVVEQMAHGCFKLLNQTLNQPIFEYDQQKIFHCLLQNFALVQTKNNGPKNQSKSLKTKNKYKKIMYDIIKSMIFNNSNLLNIFVEKIAPKLQAAQWRRNSYSSWSLEQQKRQKKYFCGLQNLAATCYINCLFQQLFMIRRFTDRFINIDSLAYKEIPEGNQIYQLQKLLTYLKYGNKRSYTTRQFCQSFITYEGVPIDPTVQNDADEFFNALMEKIQGFLKSSGQHDILEDTFQGKLSNQLNCQGCPHSSEKIESFLSIGLNIKNKKTLEAAFDGYVQGQILDGDNAYYCEKCQKKVRTMKRMCIKQVPNILVVVLKRFSYNFDEMRKTKINDELKFPQDINIKKYTSQFNLGEQCKPDEYYDYKLRGAVIHAGTSEGGHYYSFIKQQVKQGSPKWYEFNDQIIQQADYKRIQQDGFGGEQKDTEFKSQKYKNAYILFYEKKQMIQKNKSKIEQSNSINEQNIMVEQQSFQNQLAEVVKSENRNADFLSIILDQLFIRLCENIAMCGHQNAHHFILLYFHTVLLRDKNKQDQHLANIYRIILTIMSSSPQLCVWYLQQIDQNYIKQFVIQAPKLVKYLCLGFLKEAIKIVNQTSNQLEQQIKKNKNPEKIIKAQMLQVQDFQPQKIKDDAKTEVNQETKIEMEENSSPELGQTQKKQEQIQKKQKKQSSVGQDKLPAQQLLKRYENVINNLIQCFLSCLKPKGMTPFAKILTYLSSIPKYKKILISNKYPERIAEIVSSLKPKQIKIQFSSRNTYFGKQNSTGKQKDLQMSYSFLIQSLRYYPGYLEKSIILNLLNQCSSRPAAKSLTFLLAKCTQTSQEVLQNIEVFQTKLMNDKYKREDIQKYLFLIRYYFILASVEAKDTMDTRKISYLASVKSICVNSLTIVIKSNETSYQLMELTVAQLNKLAFICQDFKKDWAEKVSNNEGLYKSFQYWVSESSRPHFLYRSDEWKKKTINISYSQKDHLAKQNRETQQERTNWMLEKKYFKTKKEESPIEQLDLNKKQSLEYKVPQMHSQLQITQVNKNITVGYKTFKICERLGILTKVLDEKGSCRWGIIERNDVDTYLDF